MKDYMIICMCCGKKSGKIFSHSKFKYRVIKRNDEIRDFCSTKCLLRYYGKVLKQEKLK